MTIDELKRRVRNVPGLTPHPTCEKCGRQVPAKDFDAHLAGHQLTPADLLELHDAVIDATIGKAGPRTFLRHLAEVVAAHLKTRDPAVVHGAIARLVDRGLVRPMGEKPLDLQDPREMVWVEAF